MLSDSPPPRSGGGWLGDPQDSLSDSPPQRSRQGFLYNDCPGTQVPPMIHETEIPPLADLEAPAHRRAGAAVAGRRVRTGPRHSGPLCLRGQALRAAGTPVRPAARTVSRTEARPAGAA